jgi:hypothetical protein
MWLQASVGEGERDVKKVGADTVDWLAFIASVIGSLVKLAWPAALFGAVWIFRDKIGELLPLLRFKYKDFDVSFRFKEAEREASELPELENGQAPQTPEEKSKFERLAEISPRAAILESRAEMEATLKDLVDSKSVAHATSAISRPMALGQLIRLARSEKIIDPQTSALLDDLRVIANKAAHDTVAVFTSDEALRFRDLASKANNQILATKWHEPLPPG